ncbi:uncharacterized protein DUF4276 [Desulfobotulus alkaliphilus]|uniref:Uncharacterized protein DUF4276 n=1 Tax=Desulfobotulus alkaliphilus TaxID=622671 RepID=A0A562S0F7_9BACT|nr:DUF4276 family protein [Desulfobotulus alkaliphilus]TWI74404.1 uncharacterized protein DUF4276 [Desulfobotulus alkaliphilus]
MHFEFLVEGQAELTALSILMNRVLGDYGQPHTWRIHKHRGIGRIPDDPGSRPNKHDQTLLHNLPSKLRAYGDEGRDDVVVVVLVDLDERPDCVSFKKDLVGLLNYCQQQPKALFRIAIEELEAWFLGDQQAIRQAYPDARQEVLDAYVQDSQCGTWEKLAEAIHPGGLTELGQHGKRSVRILEQKRIWAKKLSPLLDIQANQSPSFRAFRDGVRRMTAP